MLDESILSYQFSAGSEDHMRANFLCAWTKCESLENIVWFYEESCFKLSLANAGNYSFYRWQHWCMPEFLGTEKEESTYFDYKMWKLKRCLRTNTMQCRKSTHLNVLVDIKEVR